MECSARGVRFDVCVSNSVSKRAYCVLRSGLAKMLIISEMDSSELEKATAALRLPTSQQQLISKGEYDESGPTFVHGRSINDALADRDRARDEGDRPRDEAAQARWLRAAKHRGKGNRGDPSGSRAAQGARGVPGPPPDLLWPEGSEAGGGPPPG